MINEEERKYIVKIIRRETGCGMMGASMAFDKLLLALRCRPVVMDNPYKLKITWEDELRSHRQGTEEEVH